jgi:hypothetical protein
MRGTPTNGNSQKASMESAHLHERREKRYEVSIEIEVLGFDHAGQPFQARAFTRNVSEWGCAFLSKVELYVDDLVAVRAVPGAAQALFQIVRVEREREGWSVGAWKVGGVNIWLENLEGAEKQVSEPRRTAKRAKK